MTSPTKRPLTTSRSVLSSSLPLSGASSSLFPSGTNQGSVGQLKVGAFHLGGCDASVAGTQQEHRRYGAGGRTSSCQQQRCRERPRVRQGPFVLVTVLIQNADAAAISFMVCLAWKRLSAQNRLLWLSISYFLRVRSGFL